ncbi:MAG: alpha-E domain-containing protein [Mycobacteriales bacterium]
MLSRAAEALFWIGRYAERAEDTARLLDVHFHQIVVDPAVDEAETCRVVATVMGLHDRAPETMRGVLDLLAFDAENPSSITGSLYAARENARGVREALSGEIWECLNATHLELPRRVSAARQFGPAPFFTYVRQRAAMLSGYVASTISRDAGYDFLALGRSLERADMTARLLAAAVSTPSRDDDWVTTLQACSAHEAYLRTYQRGISSRLALEFLLLDRLFPRSVLHALTVGDEALGRLDPSSGRTGGLGDDARRVIGRVRTDLEFLPLDQLLDGLPERLHRIQRGMSHVSEAVAGRYFATPAVLGWTLEEAQR